MQGSDCKEKFNGRRKVVNQRRRRVTAHDVAMRAGVSQSAVSRAFTQGASISPETRQRILEAARALGYRPNYLARSLITNRSSVIGVAVGHLDNPFFPSALQRLSDRLRDEGYRILLFAEGAGRGAPPMLEDVLHYRVDGLVLVSTVLSSELASECREVGLPIVLFNRTVDDADVSSVTGENVFGARAIAALMAAAGHRRFAYVAGLEDSSTNRDRHAGFTGYLREHGLELSMHMHADYCFEQARAVAHKILAQPDGPRAIFCANDYMAIAVMDVARHELGLRVGEDVSIAGFDDIAMAAWSGYGLTTYSQPVEQMIDNLVQVLAQRLGGKASAAQHIVCPGRLVVRSSVRRPTHRVELDGRVLWDPAHEAA